MAGEIFMVTNLTDHFVGPDVRGSSSLKWPKTHYGVLVLLAEIPRDGSVKLDVDEAMRRLGWRRIKSLTDGNQGAMEPAKATSASEAP